MPKIPEEFILQYPYLFFILTFFFLTWNKKTLKTMGNKICNKIRIKKVPVPKNSLPIKELNVIASYSRQAFVYYFDRHITIYNFDEGEFDLQKIIEKQRKLRQRLVMNLVETDTLNGIARDVFLTVFRRVIAENNLDFLVVFPDPETLNEVTNKNMLLLIRGIQTDIKNKPSEAIKVKIDDRGESR